MRDTAGSAAAELRSWAAGSYALEAAVELLCRAFDGRFASSWAPWIVPTDTGRSCWLDPDLIDSNSGVYSGGERRLLTLVQALASDGMWLDLGAVLPGLDRLHQALVLAAIAHASGSHEHSEWTIGEDGQSRFVRLPSLFPWPDDDLSEGVDQ